MNKESSNLFSSNCKNCSSILQEQKIYGIQLNRNRIIFCSQKCLRIFILNPANTDIEFFYFDNDIKNIILAISGYVYSDLYNQEFDDIDIIKRELRYHQKQIKFGNFCNSLIKKLQNYKKNRGIDYESFEKFLYKIKKSIPRHKIDNEGEGIEEFVFKTKRDKIKFIVTVEKKKGEWEIELRPRYEIGRYGSSSQASQYQAEFGLIYIPIGLKTEIDKSIKNKLVYKKIEEMKNQIIRKELV
nr:MAG: Zn finger protein [uncultured archaeon]